MWSCRVRGHLVCLWNKNNILKPFNFRDFLFELIKNKLSDNLRKMLCWSRILVANAVEYIQIYGPYINQHKG